MPKPAPAIPHLLLVSCCLLASACNDSSSQNDPRSDTATGTSGNMVASTPEPLLEDDYDRMVVGSPGTAVDCGKHVPCRWVSDDAQFSLTVSNSDTIASRSRLSISYAIETLHDTRLMIARTENAVDEKGLALRASGQTLVDGTGAQLAMAGEAVNGNTTFDTSTTADSLTSWAIQILDGGELRRAAFRNLPVGSPYKAYADCRNTLPCTWQSADGVAHVTILSAGNPDEAAQLSVELAILTAGDLTLSMESGSSAIGSDGVPFDAHIQSLGSLSSEARLTGSSSANSPLAASIVFHPTNSVPMALDELLIRVFQEAPVPRWNPRFVNVPVN